MFTDHFKDGSQEAVLDFYVNLWAIELIILFSVWLKSQKSRKDLVTVVGAMTDGTESSAGRSLLVGEMTDGTESSIPTYQRPHMPHIAALHAAILDEELFEKPQEPQRLAVLLDLNGVLVRWPSGAKRLNPAEGIEEIQCEAGDNGIKSWAYCPTSEVRTLVDFMTDKLPKQWPVFANLIKFGVSFWSCLALLEGHFEDYLICFSWILQQIQGGESTRPRNVQMLMECSETSFAPLVFPSGRRAIHSLWKGLRARSVSCMNTPQLVFSGFGSLLKKMVTSLMAMPHDFRHPKAGALSLVKTLDIADPY